MSSKGEGKEYEDLWLSAISQFEDIHATFEPIRIPVQGVIETPGDLLFEIDRAVALGRLTPNDQEEASLFFGKILQSGNQKAIIAGLEYENGDQGLEAKLIFPKSYEAPDYE